MLLLIKVDYHDFCRLGRCIKMGTDSGYIKKKSLKFNDFKDFWRDDFKDFWRVPSRIRTDDIQNHNLTL